MKEQLAKTIDRNMLFLYNIEKVLICKCKGSQHQMKLVVKIGTSTLTHATGKLNIRKTEEFCRVLSDLKNAGHQIILVSSGAIGMGVGKLGLASRPADIPTKQAAAAVGQCELMDTYDRLFSEFHHIVAQILLTGDDFGHTDRLTNFQNTIQRLLELGVLPIINENDTIATDEIKVGDNDTLSAMVAINTRSDLLVLLSDIDGFYTADPRKDQQAVIIPEVRDLTNELLALAGGSGTERGTGGMKSKLQAAKLCMENGVDMVILNGNSPEKIYDLIDGNPAGTRFYAKGAKV